MGIELMLLSLNLNFIYFSLYLDDLYGQLFSLFILVSRILLGFISLWVILHLAQKANTLIRVLKNSKSSYDVNGSSFFDLRLFIS